LNFARDCCGVRGTDALVAAFNSEIQQEDNLPLRIVGQVARSQSFVIPVSYSLTINWILHESMHPTLIPKIFEIISDGISGVYQNVLRNASDASLSIVHYEQLQVEASSLHTGPGSLDGHTVYEVRMIVVAFNSSAPSHIDTHSWALDVVSHFNAQAPSFGIPITVGNQSMLMESFVMVRSYIPRSLE
jgi:hypothetical protein